MKGFKIRNQFERMADVLEAAITPVSRTDLCISCGITQSCSRDRTINVLIGAKLLEERGFFLGTTPRGVLFIARYESLIEMLQEEKI